MRRFKYLLLVLLMLLSAAILLALNLGRSSPGSIEGFVFDEKSAPVARVSVEAFNIMHGGTSMASAQPNGFFRIGDLAGGRYSLWVEARGYTSERIPVVIVEDGQATRKDIQLKRELALRWHSDLEQTGMVSLFEILENPNRIDEGAATAERKQIQQESRLNNFERCGLPVERVTYHNEKPPLAKLGRSFLEAQ